MAGISEKDINQRLVTGVASNSARGNHFKPLASKYGRAVAAASMLGQQCTD